MNHKAALLRYSLAAVLLAALLPSLPLRAEPPLAVLDAKGYFMESLMSQFGPVPFKQGSVVLLDPESYETLGSVPTGLTPSWVGYGPDVEYLYILNSGYIGSKKPRGSQASLSVVNLQTLSLETSIDLDPAADLKNVLETLWYASLCGTHPSRDENRWRTEYTG